MTCPGQLLHYLRNVPAGLKLPDALRGPGIGAELKNRVSWLERHTTPVSRSDSLPPAGRECAALPISWPLYSAAAICNTARG